MVGKIDGNPHLHPRVVAATQLEGARQIPGVELIGGGRRHGHRLGGADQWPLRRRLGLGPPETSPEWGVMLQKAMRYVQGKEQWIVLPPGIAISLTVLGFNLFGDGLRDAFDPRQSQ